MSSGRLITGGLVLLLATLPATAPVAAAPHHYPRVMVVQDGHDHNGGISLDKVIEKVLKSKLAAPHQYPRIMSVKNDHKNNGGISLDQAIAKARQSNKDKVLSAETIQQDGRKIYRIKILTKKGRVKRIRIDARTGKKL